LQPGITETNLQTAWDNNSSNKQKFLLRNTAENRQILSLMIPETITITPPSVEKTFYSAIGGTILLVANVGGSTGVDKDYPQDVK
jgi:predicted secreted Zn-dependent protease